MGSTTPKRRPILQEVLYAETVRPSLRAEVLGVTHEDPRLLVRGKPIGFTRCPSPYSPKTILHALADGWRLLCPPMEREGGVDWWLVREVADV